MSDTTLSPFERGYSQAQLRFHRGLERLHGDLARELAVLLEDDADDVPPVKGPIQRRVIAAPGIATELGRSAGELASDLNYDEANIYTVLKSLETSGVLESDESATPRRWRLAVKHRRARVLRMSRLVPDGRWTTYGDFAIAVYGNVRMARTVGRVAAKNPAFVHPHRVLNSGGLIPEGWRDGEGQGPEECQRRLEDEGVGFGDGSADPGRFIGWEELQGLLEADEAADGLDEEA